MRRRSLTVLLLTVTLAGCGSFESHKKDGDMKVAMNMQEGADAADAILLDTFAAVQPPLTWAHDAATERACGDTNSTATGTATRRATVMTKVSAVRRGSLLGVVERHWKKRGYKITSVDADEELPAIYAATPEDFRMSVAVGHEGQFFLSITTPCFAKSEVSPPRARPDGPTYSRGPLPPPDIHDHFWSSRDPLPASSPSTP